MYAPNQAPLHSSLERSQLSGEYLAFRMYGILEGVVVRARFKDDPTNISSRWTEYDVMEVSTRQVYPRARLGSLVGGVKNYDETVLAETTGTTDGSPLILDSNNPDAPPTPTYKLNGERVVFACLSGVYNNPIILAVLPHPDGDVGVSRNLAPRRIERFNGWTSIIDKEKNYILQHEDGRELHLNTNGSVVLRNQDASYLHLKPDGSIDLAQSAGALQLGSSSTVYSVARAEALMPAIQTVMAALTAVGAAISGWVLASGPVIANPFATAPLMTAMTTALATAQGALTGLLNQIPSPTVRVP